MTAILWVGNESPALILRKDIIMKFQVTGAHTVTGGYEIFKEEFPVIVTES